MVSERAGRVGWAYSPTECREGDGRWWASTPTLLEVTVRFAIDALTRFFLYRCLGLALFCTLLLAMPASAKPSQEDVFKSIQDNVSQSDASGPTNPLPWI